MWSWVEKLLGRSEDQPRGFTSISDPSIVQIIGGVPTVAGVPVTESTVLGISAFFRAGALTTSTIAGLPLHTYRDRPDPDRPDETMRQRVNSWVDEPAGPDHYTGFEWAELMCWHLFMHGNTFLAHRYDGFGRLAGASPVHPQAVRVEWADAFPDGRPIKGDKLYTVELPGTRTVRPERKYFDADTMTQVMGPTLDGLRGLSILGMARSSMSTTIAVERTAAAVLGRGPLVSGLVTPADDDLADGEAKLIEEQVNERLTGQENAGKIRVINRKLTFSPWSMSLDDMQFLQSRAFQVEEVARWTGIPPHLLMQTEKQTSWGTGVEQQERGLRRFNLVGWTSRIEQRLTRLTPRGQFVEFDFAGLERGSASDEINLLIAQIKGGLMTINEARHVRNLPPVAGGDLLRLDGVPIDPSVLEAAPAAPALEPANRHTTGASVRPVIHVRAERIEPRQLESARQRNGW